LQIDLVHSDRVVPAAGRVRSREPCTSASAQRAAVQNRIKNTTTRRASGAGSRGRLAMLNLDWHFFPVCAALPLAPAPSPDCNPTPTPRAPAQCAGPPRTWSIFRRRGKQDR
jgi:hypothetical protein